MITGASIDVPKMMAQKDAAVSGLTKGIEGLFKKNKVSYVRGWASFKSATEIEVSPGDNGGEAQTLRAKNVIIATGSEVTPLPGLEIDEEKIVSSTGALKLKEVPKKMVVIGGGYIGLEMVRRSETVLEFWSFLLMERERARGEGTGGGIRGGKRERKKNKADPKKTKKLKPFLSGLGLVPPRLRGHRRRVSPQHRPDDGRRDQEGVPALADEAGLQVQAQHESDGGEKVFWRRRRPLARVIQGRRRRRARGRRRARLGRTPPFPQRAELGSGGRLARRARPRRHRRALQNHLALGHRVRDRGRDRRADAGAQGRGGRRRLRGEPGR